MFSVLCAGIVHSDLKPANFVIVNASLKLIDFGIANRIQPDVTSIMKDSQVRFLLLIRHTLKVALTYAGYQTQVGTLNYMPPEAIKDTSSQPGKARSKVLLSLTDSVCINMRVQERDENVSHIVS